MLDDVIKAWKLIEPYFKEYIAPLLVESNLWLILAPFMILLVVQAFKAVYKHVMNKHFPNFDRFYRRCGIFAFAFIAGFVIVMVFVDKPNAWKWGIANGILNPVLYVYLVGWADRTNRIRLLAFLKMRNVIKVKDVKTGEVTTHLDETVLLSDQVEKYMKRNKNNEQT